VISLLGLGGPAPEELLDEALAVSVESISKTYSEIHEARYRPAVSIFAHLRERRSGTPAGTVMEPVVEDEDDDDEDEVDELLLGREVAGALADVSFDVRRGEAVVVTGSEGAAGRTVARILCRMISPTSGRVVIRGRVAPSVELAISLSRGETTTRGVARRLAGLAGPGRRHRSEFVQAAFALAFGDSPQQADVARPSKQVLRRVAAAAAFDPTADVLIIDDLSDFGDPDFPRRCRDRLAERLSEGAGAIITASDPAPVSDLCSRAVWLDEGRVAKIAPAIETVSLPSARVSRDPEAEGASASRLRAKPRLPFSDQHAALRSLDVLRCDGAQLEDARLDDWIIVRVAFDIATNATTKLVVRFGGAETFDFVERGVLEVGRYVATLRIPPGVVSGGEYDVAVGLILENEGHRTKVGLRDAARVRVDGDEEGLVAAAEAGFAPAVADPDAVSEAEWSLEAASN